MNNSVLLYIYDAKLTNPNGDPDEENRPRMDYEREINLVSDLRLKRYVRDYFLDKGKELFVQSIDNQPVTAENRIKMLKDTSEQGVLEQFVDVRLFGATMPVKNDNKTFIGPVQFNWGYSLNKVDLLESSITSHFASSEGNKQGSIGKDYRVKYSLIAFSGVVSGKRAERTRLSEEDLALLDEAMKKAIPLLATRSKIGQYPRLYVRVEFKDNETILNDLRDYIDFVEKNDNIREISECSIEVGRLIRYLNNDKDIINKVYYFADADLELLNEGTGVSIEEVLAGFNMSEIK